LLAISESKNPLLTRHQYRPDIDGLRAIAVLLVVIFHAFPELPGGGFVGVDIFFVISGYLITRIIIKDLDLCRFSFKGFYARRIKRIYPALLLVLSVCYLAGWLLLLPDEFASLAKHTSGGAGFVANFLLWRESGYFDIQTELKPLLHLWSLGVEEQFYFIWPLLLFLAYKKHRKLLWLLAVIFSISFLCNIKQIRIDPVGTFYLPHTRFWELITGAFVAYIPNPELANNRQNPPPSKNGPNQLNHARLLSNAYSLFGFFLLTLAVIILNKNRTFPGWWAILPTFGAALMINAGSQAWLNKKILAHPVLVFIGIISYPLYLWHWPLLAFARIMEMGKASIEIRASMALASVFLAWLTYRFIELPLRFGESRFNKTFALSVLMVLTFIIACSTFLLDGLPHRMEEKAKYDRFFSHHHYTYSHNLLKHDRHECNFYNITQKVAKDSIASSCVTPHSKQTVFLWGDSHAQHLNYGLKLILPANVSLLQAGSSGCPPSTTDYEPDPLQTCNKANHFIWEKLAELKPKIVILAQQADHNPSQYVDIVAKLKRLGVSSVIVVGPVPQWNEFLYRIILKKHWHQTENRLKTYLNQGIFSTDDAMKAKFHQTGYVHYVSLIDGLCNQKGCLTYVNNDRKEGLITYDYGHFTLPASEFVAREFLAPVIGQILSI
jgi:peptidoglycan/LPS O-acetylase OafA/YrhL